MLNKKMIKLLSCFIFNTEKRRNFRNRMMPINSLNASNVNHTHNQNILFTLWFADGLHGGVKYVMELADYFQKKGYNTHLAVVLTTPKMVKIFSSLNIEVFDARSMSTDICFDIVWAHHFPILPYLIKNGLNYKRLINSCISAFLPIEKPMLFYDQTDMILVLLSHMKETLVKDYHIPAEKIHVLPNTAPDAFFDYPTTLHSQPNKIAVVSNHIPPELKEAKKILSKRGVEVCFYGKGHRVVNITPAVLSKYDVVITIGKTVQYCLALGIPVYNYDIYGGSGYITTSNIFSEGEHNFSGCSTRIKKSGQQIAQEIISRYNSVVEEIPILKQYAEANYKLSTKIDHILSVLNAGLPCSPVKITPENRLFFDYCQFIMENKSF